MRYRIILIHILFILCIVSVFSCGGGDFSPIEIPKAERGVLDLREWDFDNDGPALLEGEFGFLWNELSERSWTDVSSFATVPK
ncbi:hypothetical protein CH375_14910, partial [Leptospira ellisii]